MVESGFDVCTALAYIGLVLFVWGGFWLGMPGIYGTSGALSRPDLIRAAFDLIHLMPGEKVYDLGAGDGRVVVAAAKAYQARGVGVEIEPTHCLVAWLRALVNGVVRRVSIRQKNLFDVNLDDADVVFLYLSPKVLERLAPQLILKLRPGTRVVSVHFPIEGWLPVDVNVGYLLFVYQMPPQPGGVDDLIKSWQVT
ncbi:MAG: 50S ribosomal protein L11 methyltransferase [Anaerolineae bacterium]|nr:50S ribosomal protein L11 methyltransferase [Anaerolineae bacterium]